MKTVLTSVITTLLVLLCFFHPLCIFLIAYLGIGALFVRADRLSNEPQEDTIYWTLLFLFLWPICIAGCLVDDTEDTRKFLSKVVFDYKITFHKPITFTKNDSV